MITRILFLIVFGFMIPQGFAGELVSWNNNVSEDFSSEKCITIKGTPGTPQKCAPSYTQDYSCPSFKNPKKTCKHTIGGACTPAIPGTPDKNECGNVHIGNLSIAVDGGVYVAYEGINDSEVALQTTAHVALAGKKAALPITCKVFIGKKVSICLNLLTRTFAKTVDAGYSCEIAGADVASISYPGVTTNLCMDVTVNGVAGKPSGTVVGRVAADVEFGNASVAGQSISMGNKGWNPNLFSVKF